MTNTVWWQDFPRRSMPDFSSLFTHLSYGEANENSKSDFVAQLAGFMASLLADVPTQAHWIMELAKYDFRGAVGHLVASIPGFHMQSLPYPSEAMHFLSVSHFNTLCEKTRKRNLRIRRSQCAHCGPILG